MSILYKLFGLLIGPWRSPHLNERHPYYQIAKAGMEKLSQWNSRKVKVGNGSIELSAYYYPVYGSKKLAIFLHGFGGDGRHDFGAVAALYHDAGYSVLIPSLRAHDESGGDAVGFGILDVGDICAWLDKFKPESFTLYGSSMGATAAANFAECELDVGYYPFSDHSGSAKLEFMVLDCPYLCPAEQISFTAANFCGLARFWGRDTVFAKFVRVLFGLAGKLLTFVYKPYCDLRRSILWDIDNIKCDVFLMQGSADRVIYPETINILEQVIDGRQNFTICKTSAGHQGSINENFDALQAWTNEHLNK